MDFRTEPGSGSLNAEFNVDFKKALTRGLELRSCWGDRTISHFFEKCDRVQVSYLNCITKLLFRWKWFYTPLSIDKNSAIYLNSIIFNVISITFNMNYIKNTMEQYHSDRWIVSNRTWYVSNRHQNYITFLQKHVIQIRFATWTISHIPLNTITMKVICITCIPEVYQMPYDLDQNITWILSNRIWSVSHRHMNSIKLVKNIYDIIQVW